MNNFREVNDDIIKEWLEFREENGSFRKIEDIQNVKGIGEAKYNDLKEQIEV